MPKNHRNGEKGSPRIKPHLKERRALRQIIRLVEEWTDNGRKRHETTLLRILNTALGVL
jgi:hypothetical protein